MKQQYTKSSGMCVKWWSNRRAGELRCKCGQRVVWVHDVADEQLGLQLQPGVCVTLDKSHSGSEAVDCDTRKHSSEHAQTFLLTVHFLPRELEPPATVCAAARMIYGHSESRKPLKIYSPPGVWHSCRRAV